MNDITQFNFPTTIRFGKNVIAELPQYLKSNNIKRPLIVTDKFLVDLAFFKNIIIDLEKHKLSPLIFNDISKNPVRPDVHKGADFYNENHCDSIIGVGGGASMDVARAIALKANHSNDLFYYEEGVGGDKFITNPIPHFIAVPTTAGTGSEVGRSAIISDEITHEKKILFHPNLLAKIIFADPMLTMDLPAPITAATGMDALTHNIEAYFSKMWHPMCDGIAIEGIKLIKKSIKTATLNPDYQSRKNMLLGSLMGAVAFQKGLGVVHSMAHPMSSLFDTHHGLANAIALPYGVRFNKEVVPEKYKDISEIFKTVDLFSFLTNLNVELGLPTKFSKLGVTENDIEKLSALAIDDFCHPSNPRTLTIDLFKELYRETL